MQFSTAPAPKTTNLLETLAALGYTTRPAKFGRLDVLSGAERIFTGSDKQIWNWLAKTRQISIPRPRLSARSWRDLVRVGERHVVREAGLPVGIVFAHGSRGGR